ncbi:MAG: hypothetical protein AAB438_00450 [Patescibacteria group bacterium]
MEKIIKNIRNKPEEERRHLLHFFTIIFAIIMFILWTYTLGSTFSDPETQEKIKEDLQPFNQLKENLVNNDESVSEFSANTDTQ